MQTESKIINAVLQKLHDEDVFVFRLHDAFLCSPLDAKHVSSKLVGLGVATNINRPHPSGLMKTVTFMIF